MFKSLYKNLAQSSLKRYRNLFVPFIGTGIFLMVLTGLCISLLGEKSFRGQSGMAEMGTVLMMAIVVLLFFSLLSLSSVYSFIQNRKLKESGLLLSLGLEKKHLRKILAWEMLYLFIWIALPGFLLTIILYKISLGLYIKVTGLNIDPFAGGLVPELQPLIYCVLAYGLVFIFLFLLESIKTARFSPQRYMQESRAGDRKDGLGFIKGLLGVLSLAGGYGISIFTKDPLNSLFLFLPAVLLVIVGTYLAFSVIISWFLRLLKSRKNYYYKKENFTAISGLLYRIKNHSKSLSNIAILSTAVMVVASSGISLYIGAEERTKESLPSDYVFTLYGARPEVEEKFNKLLEDYREKENLPGEIKAYQGVDFPAMEEEGILKPVVNVEGLRDFYSLKDIQLIYAPKASLDFGDKDYIWVKSGSRDKLPKMAIKGFDYKTIEASQSYLDLPSKVFVTERFNIYVKDLATIEKFSQVYKVKGLDMDPTPMYLMNRTQEGPMWKDFAYKIRQEIERQIPQGKDSIRVEDRDYRILEARAMYGSIFYVGILLTVAFLLSTGLAIYYKQLTEGYEDRDRFKIMQQVGMSQEEGKKSIQKQIRMVFVLPLAFALTHTLFAYPIVRRILLVIGMYNDRLFIGAIFGVFILFSLFYSLVYKLTARVYKALVLS